MKIEGPEIYSHAAGIKEEFAKALESGKYFKNGKKGGVLMEGIKISKAVDGAIREYLNKELDYLGEEFGGDDFKKMHKVALSGKEKKSIKQLAKLLNKSGNDGLELDGETLRDIGKDVLNISRSFKTDETRSMYEGLGLKLYNLGSGCTAFKDYSTGRQVREFNDEVIKAENAEEDVRQGDLGNVVAIAKTVCDQNGIKVNELDFEGDYSDLAEKMESVLDSDSMKDVPKEDSSILKSIQDIIKEVSKGGQKVKPKKIEQEEDDEDENEQDGESDDGDEEGRDDDKELQGRSDRLDFLIQGLIKDVSDREKGVSPLDKKGGDAIEDLRHSYDLKEELSDKSISLEYAKEFDSMDKAFDGDTSIQDAIALSRSSSQESQKKMWEWILLFLLVVVSITLLVLFILTITEDIELFLHETHEQEYEGSMQTTVEQDLGIEVTEGSGVSRSEGDGDVGNTATIQPEQVSMVEEVNEIAIDGEGTELGISLVDEALPSGSLEADGVEYEAHEDGVHEGEGVDLMAAALFGTGAALFGGSSYYIGKGIKSKTTPKTIPDKDVFVNPAARFVDESMVHRRKELPIQPEKKNETPKADKTPLSHQESKSAELPESPQKQEVLKEEVAFQDDVVKEVEPKPKPKPKPEKEDMLAELQHMQGSLNPLQDQMKKEAKGVLLDNAIRQDDDTRSTEQSDINKRLAELETRLSQAQETSRTVEYRDNPALISEMSQMRERLRKNDEVMKELRSQVQKKEAHTETSFNSTQNLLNVGYSQSNNREYNKQPFTSGVNDRYPMGLQYGHNLPPLQEAKRDIQTNDEVQKLRMEMEALKERDIQRSRELEAIRVAKISNDVERRRGRWHYVPEDEVGQEPYYGQPRIGEGWLLDSSKERSNTHHAQEDRGYGFDVGGDLMGNTRFSNGFFSHTERDGVASTRYGVKQIVEERGGESRLLDKSSSFKGGDVKHGYKEEREGFGTGRW